MTDYFALLGQPRRPWLEPEALKEAFHKLALAHHPDTASANEGSFPLLNEAYAALRDPASRLKHLLELDGKSAPGTANQVPAGLADVFLQLAERRQRLGEFLARKTAASSPLALALLASEQVTLTQEWVQMQACIEESCTQATAQLRSVDALWPSDSSEIAGHLDQLQKQFAYLARWSAQIRESLLALEL